MSYTIDNAGWIPTPEEMELTIKGLFVWHRNHDGLFACVALDDFEVRTEEIKKHKQGTCDRRLVLMQYVKMEIPQDLQESADLMWVKDRQFRWLHGLMPAGKPVKDFPDVEAARVEWITARDAYEERERWYLPEFYLAHRTECLIPNKCMWNGAICTDLVTKVWRP